MMKVIKWLVLIGGILTLSSTARAQEIEWDDSTRLALGQCMVGEAGWRNRTEHAAMAHTLRRNWQRFVATHPEARFEERVRQYCAMHRVTRPSPRQLWVRNLPWAVLEADPGMNPEQTDWRNWVDDWDYVRETVMMFEAGILPDPLPEAQHWGCSADGVPTGGVLLARTVRSESGVSIRLNNYFYRIDPGVIRRIRAARRLLEEGSGPIPADIARART